MKKKMTFSHIFNQHEYILLLNLLEPKAMFGVEYPYSNAQQAQAAMEEALEKLQERGYVIKTSDKILPAPSIAPLVSTCAAPERVFMATFANTQQEQAIRFFYFDKEITVEDQILSNQKRQLMPIVSLQVVERLIEQFHIKDQPAAPGETIELPISVLEAAGSVVQDGTQETVSHLQASGVREETAISLSQALVNPVSHSALFRVNFGADIADEPGLELLESSQGLWEMHFMTQDQVRLAPTNAQDFIQKIRDYLS